jgi:hypothetical protein
MWGDKMSVVKVVYSLMGLRPTIYFYANGADLTPRLSHPPTQSISSFSLTTTKNNRGHLLTSDQKRRQE